MACLESFCLLMFWSEGGYTLTVIKLILDVVWVGAFWDWIVSLVNFDLLRIWLIFTLVFLGVLLKKHFPRWSSVMTYRFLLMSFLSELAKFSLYLIWETCRLIAYFCFNSHWSFTSFIQGQDLKLHHFDVIEDECYFILILI